MYRASVKNRIRAGWDALWDRGELDALDDLMTPGFTRTTPATGASMTLADLKETVRTTRAGFPDLSTTIDHLVVEGSEVAIFWHSTGTHESAIFGVPPTHRRVWTYGCNLCLLEGDMIAAEEVTWDPRQILQALGITTLGDAL